MTQKEAHEESENLGTSVSCNLIEKIQMKYEPENERLECICPEHKEQEYCYFNSQQ